jgi:hypothetical protein
VLDAIGVSYEIARKRVQEAKDSMGLFNNISAESV